MMSPAQTAGLLTDNFPELDAELHAPTNLASVYRQLVCFAAYTRTAAVAGELARLQRCFDVADELLQRGDACLAAAVENVYLYSLHLDGCTRDSQLVRLFMPAGLYRAYVQQHCAMLP